MGADTTRTVMAYIERIAQEHDVFVELQQHRFRLHYTTDSRSWAYFREYLYECFVESDLHLGLPPEQIERERQMMAGPIRGQQPTPMGLPSRRRRDGPTLRDRLIEFVRANPGLTATQIAKALQLSNDHVASVLVKEVRDGNLERRPGEGPRGGFAYYAPTTVVGPSVYDRLLTNAYT